MKAEKIAIAVLLCATLMAAIPARAGLLDAGQGARSVAMGQAQVAVANDAAAVIYNPACLIETRDYWNLKGRHILMQLGKTGYDAGHLRINGVDQDAPYTSYTLMGMVVPIGKRIAAGFMVSNSDDWTLTIQIPSSPNFVRYAPTQQPTGSFAVGLQITKKLSIGFGMLGTLHFNASQINLDLNSALSGMGLTFGNPAVNINPKIEIDVLPGSSYQFGGLYRFNKWLNIAANYTYKTDTNVHIPVNFSGMGMNESLLVSGSFGWNPTQLTLGIGFNPSSNMTMAFDYVLSFWSRANQAILITSNTPLFSQLASNPNSSIPKLKDIWTPRFGFEYRGKMRGNLSRASYAFRTGYSFYQSPYPPESNKSNNIDNDAHFFSAGISMGYTPKRGLNYIGFDYFYEYIDMVDRVHKDMQRRAAILVSSGYVTYSGFAITMKL